VKKLIATLPLLTALSLTTTGCFGTAPEQQRPVNYNSPAMPQIMPGAPPGHFPDNDGAHTWVPVDLPGITDTEKDGLCKSYLCIYSGMRDGIRWARVPNKLIRH
jgi:hypothetical protein